MFVPKWRCEKTCRRFIKYQNVAGYHRQLGKIIPICIQRLLFICKIMQSQGVIFRKNMYVKKNINTNFWAKSSKKVFLSPILLWTRCLLSDRNIDVQCKVRMCTIPELYMYLSKLKFSLSPPNPEQDTLSAA